MSTRSAHDSIGHSRDSAAIPPSPEAHESRVRFRPAKKPGRRARFAVVVAAGANQDIVATGTSLTGCTENDSGDLFAYDAAVPGSGGQGVEVERLAQARLFAGHVVNPNSV